VKIIEGSSHAVDSDKYAQGTLPGPPPYQSLQTGGRQTTIKLPSDPQVKCRLQLT